MPIPLLPQSSLRGTLVGAATHQHLGTPPLDPPATLRLINSDPRMTRAAETVAIPIDVVMTQDATILTMNGMNLGNPPTANANAACGRTSWLMESLECWVTSRLAGSPKR